MMSFLFLRVLPIGWLQKMQLELRNFSAVFVCRPPQKDLEKKNYSFVKYIDEIKDKSTGEHDGEPLDSLMLWELYVKQFMYYSLLLLT